MPDSSNNIVKKDLLKALGEAELRIEKFAPPSAGNSTVVSPSTKHPIPDLLKIQTEIANKAAQERTDALFDFFKKFIAQEASDEIAKQQIIQLLGQLKASFDELTLRVEFIENNGVSGGSSDSDLEARVAALEVW